MHIANDLFPSIYSIHLCIENGWATLKMSHTSRGCFRAHAAREGSDQPAYRAFGIQKGLWNPSYP